MADPRILVVEGNTREAREATVAAGGRETADTYIDALRFASPDAVCDVVRPTDGETAPPGGASLSDYDGIAWTGSALNVYNGGPEITSQIEMCQAALATGVPVFGSCWGLQVAVTAAGGEVVLNTDGRELGIARKIRVTEAGRGHHLYDGKPEVFDAVAVHKDEVSRLPAGATVLSSNSHSTVQAVEFSAPGGSTFWGVQYHPEFDLRDIGIIAKRYGPALVNEGFFADAAGADEFRELTAVLQADPGRSDIAWLLGADADVLDESVRLAEIRNWIHYQVIPFKARR